MKIINAECITLNIPFYAEHVTRAMHRANTHSERVYVYRLESDNGLVGYGDSTDSPLAVDHLVGLDPWRIFRDDRVGMGPQIALMDLIGKDAGVPIHAILGTKLRNRCPLSWWAIDMPPEDWVEEAKESLRRGYTSFKVKARPWRDIHDQVHTVGQVVPRDYRLDIDFNGFLLNPAQAAIHLRKLDDQVNVGMYESPFYLRRDLPGASILRQGISKPIVDHFDEGILHARASDGFVIGGTLQETLRQATLANEFRTPFWLQMVGTGITTAYSAHIGAVLLHAQLPSITCHELFESDLLTERIEVVDGFMSVPDDPGLGVEVNEKEIERYRVSTQSFSPKQNYRAQKRILTVSSPGGDKDRRVWHFTDETIYQFAFYKGNLPGFSEGVQLVVEEDNSSPAFARAHEALFLAESKIVLDGLR